MKAWQVLLIAAAMAAGCNRGGGNAPAKIDTTAPEKNPAGSAPSSIEVKLYGAWEGEMKDAPTPDPKKAKKPASVPKPSNSAQMSNGLLEAMGGYQLELRNDYTFSMSMVGLTLDGNWELVAEDIKLKPEKILDKTQAEWKTEGSDLAKDTLKIFEKPPVPKVRESGDVLRLMTESAGVITFRKKKD